MLLSRAGMNKMDTYIRGYIIYNICIIININIYIYIYLCISRNVSSVHFKRAQQNQGDQLPSNIPQKASKSLDLDWFSQFCIGLPMPQRIPSTLCPTRTIPAMMQPGHTFQSDFAFMFVHHVRRSYLQHWLPIGWFLSWYCGGIAVQPIILIYHMRHRFE